MDDAMVLLVCLAHTGAARQLAAPVLLLCCWTYDLRSSVAILTLLLLLPKSADGGSRGRQSSAEQFWARGWRKCEIKERAKRTRDDTHARVWPLVGAESSCVVGLPARSTVDAGWLALRMPR